MNAEPRDHHDVPQARPVSAAPRVMPVTRGPQSANADPLLVSERPRSVVFDLFIGCAGFFALLLPLEIATYLVFGGAHEDQPPPPAGAFIVQRLLLSAGFLLILWMLLRWRRQSFASVGLRAEGLRSAVLWGVPAFVTVFGFLMLVSGITALAWPSGYQALQQAQKVNIERLPAMSIPAAVVFSLLVAFSEELLFRGFVVTRLRVLTGSWTASILISSGVFGVLHGTQGVFPAVIIFGLSVLLGAWFVRRGNLAVAIVAHMLFDSTSLAMLNWLRDLPDGWATSLPAG